MATQNEEDDYDCEGLFEVMEENEHFQNIYNRYRSIKTFLTRDEIIYARSVTAEKVEQDVFLKYSSDVDGCVVELRSLNGFNVPVRHLTILPNGVNSVRGIYSILRKHIKLSLYSRAQLANFRNSVGIQLFYEYGWECWLGIIPSQGKPGHEMVKENLKSFCFRYFQEIKGKFQRKLNEFCVRGTASRTLMKNDINNIEKMFVLPDDSKCILGILQNSIDECDIHGDFQAVLFCFRFGEKMSGGVSLRQFQRSEISRCTVHCAIDISSDDMELFWSRDGIQSVVGVRGVLSTCASFSDCANYQSNLDGRAMDISSELRKICYHSDKLLFIQLYADIAHRRPKTRFHPVSGIIAGGMVFHKLTSAGFKKDAANYISSMKANFQLMRKSTCRLECVTELTELKDVVFATDCLNIDQVIEVLEKKPLLVPFPAGMMTCVKVVGLALVMELSRLLEEFSCTGNIGATWQAFQLELALEKMLWGQPLCFRSKALSVNLGPGQLTAGRSRTDDLGFLALDRWTACMANEDSVPPCSIWTFSDAMAGKIRRSAGIHDIMQSSSFVLGRRLLNTLIEDCFEIGKLGVFIRFEDFKEELFRPKVTRLKVNGAVTVNQLAFILSGKRRLPIAMAYGNIYHMLEKSKIDIQSVLKDGLVELGLCHFPAVKTCDTHRNAILNWSSQCGVWKIVGRKESGSEWRSSAEVLSMLVVAELEKRRIVYASKFKKLNNIRLPWIEECCRKMSREKLSDEDLLRELTFISCVALLMNGWFVLYEGIEEVIKEMPLNQYRLRDLEILSKFLLSDMNKYKLFRLHHSIPFKVTIEESKDESNQCQEREECDESANVETELCSNQIPDDEVIVENQDISYRPPTCLPVGVKIYTRWTPEELEYLHEVLSVNGQNVPISSLYESFKQKCMDNGVSFRTFKAFKHKLSRL
jgi:hypothetical protein